MIRILHVIDRLSVGGASRALVAMAAACARRGRSTHRILSLEPATSGGRGLASDAGVEVLVLADANRGSAEDVAIAGADILQVHFWNTPELYAFLARARVRTRTLLWCDIAGDTPPHVLTPQLVDWAQAVVVTSPDSLKLRALEGRSQTWRSAWTRMIPDRADFTRVSSTAPRPHDGFVVAYIGTVDFVKMHPNFVAMSARIDVPGCRFVVCGDGRARADLIREAEALGIADRFDFRGYTHDIGAVLETADVFGYPLAPDNYSTSELVLQEAMYAGVPPVILSHGGARTVVDDGETGLVVDDEAGYANAIEYLYRRPDERLRLGAAAARHARAHFGIDAPVDAADDLYNRLMAEPATTPTWSETGTPAELFADRLGNCGAAFRTSLAGGEIDELLSAEATIAAASPAVVDATAGGVLHYRRAFPADPMLRLWSGLVLHRAGRPALAVAEFTTAAKLGCGHWRVSWYLARAAADAGAADLARTAIARVLDAAPNFAPARELIK